MSARSSMLRLRLFAAVVAVAATALVVPDAARASEPLQPGAYVETTVGSCTLNFVYDGAGNNAGKVYIGTAAHCVENVGDPVWDLAGTHFGTVAFIGNAELNPHDYAFIEVAASHVGRVSPAVKGHPTYPVGYTTHTETQAGDLIQLSGYGVPFGVSRPTQEERLATLVYDEQSHFGVAGVLSWGDSGGPLVHIPTGKALGIESRVCTGPCTDTGPTLEGILAKAAAAGFPVTLRTV